MNDNIKKSECDQAPTASAQCCRQNSKSVLDDKIRSMERKVCNLRTVRAMLPTELSNNQDEALWNLLMEIR